MLKINRCATGRAHGEREGVAGSYTLLSILQLFVARLGISRVGEDTGGLGSFAKKF